MLNTDKLQDLENKIIKIVEKRATKTSTGEESEKFKI